MSNFRYILLVLVMMGLVSGCASVKPDVGQVVFASPEEAVAALRDAAKNNDAKRLLEIFGPNGREIVYSGDEQYDVESRAKFAKRLEEKADFVKEGDLVYVEFGKDNLPFAVPIAIYDGKAFFHTEVGKDELINRRIGRNELNALRICRTIVEAEEQYAKSKLAAGAAKEYASKFVGDKNAKDGLYWDLDNKDASEKNPLGALVVLASQDASPENRKPYYGYFYKILTAQGASAPGGKNSYLVDGKLKKGFALLAYPADYGSLGIMTFIVSRHGVVFEKDLGEDTVNIGAGITEYNPDDSWEPVED